MITALAIWLTFNAAVVVWLEVLASRRERNERMARRLAPGELPMGNAPGPGARITGRVVNLADYR